MNDKIIYLGDSLTFHFKNLEKYPNVINMGIGGDKTIEIIGRINTVIVKKPQKIILMLGINDFTTNKGKWETTLKIPFLKGYSLLLEIIKNSLPTTEVLVLPILPLGLSSIVSVEEINLFNREIDEINKELENLTSKFNYQFYDISCYFKNKEGSLEEAYTIDGTHLSLKGYEVYEEVMKKHLLK